MELPKRKPNRLKNYDYSKTGAYFITICVKDRRRMFGNVCVGDDAHIVPHIELSKYGIIAEKYIKKIAGIDEYVIMPNHIHMIIFIRNSNFGTMWASSPTQSIPQLIKSFKTLTTKEIGFSLFQRSYHDHIIRNEQEYREICKYIYENPLNWKDDCFYAE